MRYIICWRKHKKMLSKGEDPRKQAITVYFTGFSEEKKS